MPEDQNLVPGLSLLNLAFFLLCTPVQVSKHNTSQVFYQVTEGSLLTLNISFSIKLHVLKAILLSNEMIIMSEVNRLS